MTATPLLVDLLTLLAFLHAHDVRPRGARWLPPSALADLNAGLLLPDRVEFAANPRGGRLGTVERDTSRVSFLHFSAEAAGLVAKTGLYLKPTLRGQRWLTATASAQLRALFVAVCPIQADRTRDDLWRAYRLPGHRLPSPTIALGQLCELLRSVPPAERLKISTVLKLLPLPEAGDGADSAEACLRGWLTYLNWFGVLDWHGHKIVTLTDLGRELLLPSSSPANGAPLRVPITLQLDRATHLLEVDFPALYELGGYAALIQAAPDRRYRLDRALIQRAVQRGLTRQHLLQFLEHLLGDALPVRWARRLMDWTGELDQITLRRVTLLEVRDPQLLTDLSRTRRVRDSFKRTLSSRAVIVREVRLPALVRQLARRGLTPRLFFSSAQRATANASRSFDDPMRAQLYYAALLNHQLADRLSAPYRVDYSIVLDLEQHLSPHDQLLAQELAAEAAEQLTADPRAVFVGGLRDDSALPFADQPSTTATVKIIEQAIATHTPLTLTYRSPAYGDSTRTVEPLRLEWHGDVPYLIAFCRLRQDERIFRVDRILEISSVATGQLVTS